MEYKLIARTIAYKVSKYIGVVAIVAAGLACGVALHAAVERKEDIASAFKMTNVTAEYRNKQLDCLTRNIYWEAAGEPFEGKVAVAQVTMNRAKHPQFPNDVCGVVYEKTKIRDRVICQFSWFCERNHLVRPVHKKEFEESAVVARMVLLENFRLRSLDNAIYYHADYISPGWRKDKITKIGRHIFYRG